MKTVSINRKFRLQEKFCLGFVCKMSKLQVPTSNRSHIFFDYYFDQKLQKSCISADIAFEGAFKEGFQNLAPQAFTVTSFLKSVDINRKFRLQEKFYLGFVCKMRKLQVPTSNRSHIFFDYYFDQKWQKSWFSPR